MNLSHTLRSIFRGMPKILTGGRPGERAGEERLAQKRLAATGATEIRVMSPAFTSCSPIPKRYAQDGENLTPPLRWGAVPPETRSLVLIVEDPDAPTPEPFVHWLISELEPTRDAMPEGVPAEGNELIVQGLNSMLKTGYTGAAPPKGDIPHRYHFQLFALDSLLGLDRGFGRDELIRAMSGHVIGFGETIGTYERPIEQTARS